LFDFVFPPILVYIWGFPLISDLLGFVFYSEMIMCEKQYQSLDA